MDVDELRTRSEALTWFHSIDLGHGVVTKGESEGPFVPEGVLPALEGRTVLDIGAWDGFYSFLAERSGASRVVALDHYVWGVDFGARDRYWAECRARGVLPDHSKDLTEFWRPDLPGRRGFDLAKEALGSSVEPVLADFMTADLSALGSFDVVFYFGVLYHMKEPLTALERLRRVTASVAVIETAAVHLSPLPESSLLQFVSSDDLNADFGNWYVPTADALRSMCLAAGFAQVDVLVGPPATAPPRRTGAARLGRGVRRLVGAAPPAPPAQNYRIVARAAV